MITKLKKTKKSKSENFQTIFFSGLIGVLVLLMIGFLIFQNVRIIRKRAVLTERMEILKKEFEEIEKKHEFLKAEISQIGSEEYIEKIAREELNLQKDGEQVVAFVLPEQKEEEKEEEGGGGLWNPKNWRRWLKSKF